MTDAPKNDGCTKCGGIILADTEDWLRPLCAECWIAIGSPEIEPKSELHIDVKYDSDKLAVEAQSYIDKFRSQMSKIAEECLGEIYCQVMPYIETDTWTNYREALRIELQHEYKFSKFKQPWATAFRRAVFVENREEISKLIEGDILARIKHLEDCRQEYDQYRYSPGGDRYQDKVKELEAFKAKHERVLQALKEASKRSTYEWTDGYDYFPSDHANEGRIALANELLKILGTL